MTFRPEARAKFLRHFDTAAPKIRAFEGCQRLELWEGQRFPNVCTTFSLWANADALERYRRSNLFRENWREVKPLFAAAPVTYSHTLLRAASAIDEMTEELAAP